MSKARHPDAELRAALWKGKPKTMTPAQAKRSLDANRELFEEISKGFFKLGGVMAFCDGYLILSAPPDE